MMLDCVVVKDVPVVGVQIDTVAVVQPVGVVGVPPVPLLLVDDVVIVHVNVCLALNVPSDASTVTM